MRNIFKERADQRAELRKLAIRNEKKSSLLLDMTTASVAAVTITAVGTLLVGSYDTSEAKEWERVVRTIRRKHLTKDEAVEFLKKRGWHQITEDGVVFWTLHPAMTLEAVEFAPKVKKQNRLKEKLSKKLKKNKDGVIDVNEDDIVEIPPSVEEISIEELEESIEEVEQK